VGGWMYGWLGLTGKRGESRRSNGRPIVAVYRAREKKENRRAAEARERKRRGVESGRRKVQYQTAVCDDVVEAMF
jgi:hypothetical protein